MEVLLYRAASSPVVDRLSQGKILRSYAGQPLTSNHVLVIDGDSIQPSEIANDAAIQAAVQAKATILFVDTSAAHHNAVGDAGITDAAVGTDADAYLLQPFVEPNGNAGYAITYGTTVGKQSTATLTYAEESTIRTHRLPRLGTSDADQQMVNRVSDLATNGTPPGLSDLPTFPTGLKYFVQPINQITANADGVTEGQPVLQLMNYTYVGMLNNGDADPSQHFQLVWVIAGGRIDPGGVSQKSFWIDGKPATEQPNPGNDTLVVTSGYYQPLIRETLAMNPADPVAPKVQAIGAFPTDQNGGTYSPEFDFSVNYRSEGQSRTFPFSLKARDIFGDTQFALDDWKVQLSTELQSFSLTFSQNTPYDASTSTASDYVNALSASGGTPGAWPNQSSTAFGCGFVGAFYTTSIVDSQVNFVHTTHREYACLGVYSYRFLTLPWALSKPIGDPKGVRLYLNRIAR